MATDKAVCYSSVRAHTEHASHLNLGKNLKSTTESPSETTKKKEQRGRFS